MSRILKGPNVIVDGETSVKIDIGYEPQKHRKEAAQQKMSEVANIVDAARQEGDKIIRKAKEKAEVLFEDAKKKGLELGIQQGIEDGKKEGYTVGYTDGLKEVEDLKKEALQIIEDAKLEKIQILDEAEVETVEVIKDIIGNFFDVIYDIDDNVIIHLIRRGLRNATILETVTIKVSEEDYNDVVSQVDEFKKLVDSNKKIEIVKDFNLDVSDCVIDTEFGSIDCSLKDIKNSINKNLTMILNDR